MDQQNKETFIITVAFNGKHVTLHNITRDTTIDEIASLARETFDLPEETSLKFVMKGKVVGQGEDSTKPVFPSGLGSVSKLPPKIVIMATADQTLKELRLKRADPTIRGFDHEPKKDVSNRSAVWGPSTTQNREYKFCRLQACTWQSFGHRPTETTPHAFKAMQLLERISTDPGVVAIMIERELVVGTLGEMDPIDDRLMQKKAEQDGACLLGYNTNAGARIDIKLRTDDLSGFRAYPDLVATLIHELSHNWVGEHNALFWANYGQMVSEILPFAARTVSLT